ncbi:hypothetical protein NLU13_1934 [Sarocladium strictum]|uniref:Crossover junction endonuclease MUS81 n=1 Tax=Sarocladium strictum TaxID=5046 RepID=A0AA39GTU6_SARSR|nr:hypothetical protein NLU13_1934 [Sarocladium strictum]
MDDAETANPQLLGWVKEWYDLARERNSKGVTTYRRAYESLKACPISFEHPAELQQLNGFGPKLCQRLEECLKKHCQEHGLPMPEHPHVRKAAERAVEMENESTEAAGTKPKKTRKPKAYVPALRSGAYAIVVALASLPKDTSSAMTKAQVIEAGQRHCDSSFTAPNDPTKFYTAWNSMKTLLEKELVYERGRPLRKYALTDEGWEVAERIKGTREWLEQDGDGEDDLDQQPDQSSRVPSNSPRQTETQLPTTCSDTVPDGEAIRDTASLPALRTIRLPPGSFSVHLLLDVREVRAKTDRDYMQNELAKQGVTPIMRSLEVGDAQWVAKCHDPDLLRQQGAEGDEIVLDWIVERKRLDDLIGSIKDGRFHEQKFRLKRSGVKKVIYIIEEIALDPAMAQKYEESVTSAIASTQVVSDYFVKRTTKMDETIKYMARMTSMLKGIYENKTLNVIPTNLLTAQNYLPLLEKARQQDPENGYYITYQAFSSIASKSEMMTLRDIFLKMLMTIKGVTGERALEIQKRWKTPYEFVKAFEDCGTGTEGKKRKHELVSGEMGNLFGRKRIQKALSQKIAEVWGDA